MISPASCRTAFAEVFGAVPAGPRRIPPRERGPHGSRRTSIDLPFTSQAVIVVLAGSVSPRRTQQDGTPEGDSNGTLGMITGGRSDRGTTMKVISDQHYAGLITRISSLFGGITAWGTRS
jgi:hypothetical protein